MEPRTSITNSNQPQELKTNSVHKEKSIKRLIRTSRHWEEHAHGKIFLKDNKLVDLTEKQITQLDDSASIIYDIKHHLIEGKAKKAYIVRDKQNVIQAIAIASFKNENNLLLMATNPENIAVCKYEKATKGAGSALLAHLYTKILNKMTGSKRLHTSSLPSAVEFYEKAGFTQVSKEHRKDGIIPMVIDAPAMALFINQLPPTLRIKNREPKPENLKCETRSFTINYPSSNHYRPTVQVSPAYPAEL